jgi:acetyl-CoA carboxylase biotin carboxyl carrier protein
MADEQRKDVLLTNEVRELIALIKNTDIAELLIEHGDARLHIKRAAALPPTPIPVGALYATPVPADPVGNTVVSPLGEAEAELPSGITVTAPIVGTFYRAPGPKDPPYVEEGDEVRPGDVLGLIEAMKIMNEIECEIHGRIAQILVDNAQAVEYGQPLMIIEPL